MPTVETVMHKHEKPILCFPPVESLILMCWTKRRYWFWFWTVALPSYIVTFNPKTKLSDVLTLNNWSLFSSLLRKKSLTILSLCLNLKMKSSVCLGWKHQKRGWLSQPDASHFSPSLLLESSSLWIWFSMKSIATAKARTASSCNLGGIVVRRSPIKRAAESFRGGSSYQARRCDVTLG